MLYHTGEKTLIYKSHPWLVVWHNGSSLFLISVHVVTLLRARLVLGWMSVAGFKFCRAILVFIQIPRQTSLEYLHR